MATIIVVDDHPIARTAVRLIPEKEGHSTIAESGDGLETLSLRKNINKIITAIQVAQNGYGYFPVSVFEHQQPASSDEECDKKLVESLSPQECKVFNFILNGMDNMQIAGRMGLSNKAVSTYKTRIMEKSQSTHFL